MLKMIKIIKTRFCHNLDLRCVHILRHGKTGKSGRVRVGSIGSWVKTGYESKRVIFKRVNRVAGQTGHGLSRVASRVELTRIFQNFFFLK